MYDLIFFMGQSNMQGQTERLLQPNNAVLNAFEYKFLSDELVPLKNPVGEDITVDFLKGKPFSRGDDCDEWLRSHALGSSCFGNTNMVAYFCDSYSSNSGKKVVAVHMAKGSTTISDWQKGSIVYRAVIKKARGAINKVEKQNIASISAVWLQGESDAIFSTTKEEYKNRLIALKDDLKADLNIDKFYIIKVGSFTNDDRDEAIFDAQEELCVNDEFVMLTRITHQIIHDKNYLNPEYDGHYNAVGQKKIGETAGENLARLLRGEAIIK